MIINLFKTNQTTGLLFLLLFQVLIFINPMLHRDIVLPSFQPNIFFDLIFGGWLHFKILNLIISFILLLMQALLFNLFIIQINLLNKPTYLPAFFFLIFNAAIPQYLYINPPAIANIFIFLSLSLLFQSAQSGSRSLSLFFASMFLSLGSMFYSPLLFLFFWILISNITLSNSTLKDYLILFAGFCIPYLYTFTFYIWTDHSDVFFTQVFAAPVGWVNQFPEFSTFEILLILSLFLLVVLSFYQYISSAFLYKLMQRKFYRVLFYLFSIILIASFFYDIAYKEHLLTIVYPCAVFLSSYFLKMKKMWMADVAIVLILLLLFTVQFQFYY